MAGVRGVGGYGVEGVLPFPFDDDVKSLGELLAGLDE